MYAQLALMSGLRDIADVVELVGSSVLVWGGHRTFYFRAGITSYFGYTIKVIVIHPSTLMADSTPTIALLRSSTLISQGAEAASTVQSRLRA